MANGRNGRKPQSGRDAGGFVALPWSVLDCPAYANLSHPARSLLLEVARQYVRDNNGRLLLSGKYMAKRGWTSSDVLTRAKRDLLKAGFIFETVHGHRPNCASWYAITWQSLDKCRGYDADAEKLFRRSAYLDGAPVKNAGLTPAGGVERRSIAPSAGVARPPATPSHGAMARISRDTSTPPDGDHLEKPSVFAQESESKPGPVDACGDRMVVQTLADLWAKVGFQSKWTAQLAPELVT